MSDDLLRRDAACVWHPFTQHATAPEPLPVVSAKGAWLQLADGRRVFDAISSWWTNVHGHGHPVIADAVARQARELDHVLFAGCTHPQAVELAERLVDRAPSGLSRVFYSDDGSTAVEVALKMAFQVWVNRGRPGKRQFLALRHGYHGDTIGAMSAGDPGVFGEPYGPLLFPVARVTAPEVDRAAGRVDLDAADTAQVDLRLAELEAVLDERGDEVAALILEPLVQGASGMRMHPPRWLAGVREACTRHDVLLIADEVMTGFGRTGRMFAVEHAGIRPDLMCLSKGISGGVLPLAATLATEEIYEVFLDTDTRRGFLHGHSFTANPIACAAANASLDLFDEDPELTNVARLEAFYANRLPTLAAHPRVASVRWIGAIGAVTLADGDASYYNAVGPRLHRAFLERGLLVRPLGPVVYTLPPYVAAIADLASVYDALEELLDTLP